MVVTVEKAHKESSLENTMYRISKIYANHTTYGCVPKRCPINIIDKKNIWKMQDESEWFVTIWPYEWTRHVKNSKPSLGEGSKSMQTNIDLTSISITKTLTSTPTPNCNKDNANYIGTISVG